MVIGNGRRAPLQSSIFRLPVRCNTGQPRLASPSTRKKLSVEHVSRDSVEKMPTARGEKGLRGWIGRLRSLLGRGRATQGQSTTAFTSAFVSLGAKLAKADGVAVLAEWEAFKRFLEVPEGECDNVRRVYDQAKADSAGAVAYAERINALLGDDVRVKRDVLECLLHVACSDGILHPEEDRLIGEIASALEVSPPELRKIRALFVHDAESPYDVLGIAPDAGDDAVKAAYRAAVREAHPDRAIAAGAPAAVVKAANAKVSALNAAYDEIVEERRKERSRQGVGI